MKELLYNKIERFMLSCIKETVHDKEHVYRVLNFSLYIAENEQNVDYDVLIAAALLHDIGRDGLKKKHNVVGAEMAKEFLRKTDFPTEKIDSVYHAVLYHSNHCYGKQHTLEAKILYDADKLDAVGVMGIARSLMGTGNYNNPLYTLVNGKVNRNEKDACDTFVRYYLTHIKKNYDRFYTDSARKLALEYKKSDEMYFNAFVDFVNKNSEYHSRLGDILEN